jgi:hypothetical protein
MKKQKVDAVVERLVHAFGAPAVKVCTEYHIKVASGGSHNVYLNSRDKSIRLQLCGKRRLTEHHSVNDVISRITQHNENKTDIAAMREALRLGESIQHAYHVLLDRQLEKAIFVDAGFKDGQAKAAAILVHSNGDVDVRVRAIEIDTSGQAEVRAVLLGMELRGDDDDIHIFTDCQSIFGIHEVKNAKNVHWIPRQRNKAADRLSNMRSKDKLIKTS